MQRRFCKAGDGGAARSKKFRADLGTRCGNGALRLPLEVEVGAHHKKEKAGIGDGGAHTSQPQQPQQSPTSTLERFGGLLSDCYRAGLRNLNANTATAP
jgi:hypothetical protein